MDAGVGGPDSLQLPSSKHISTGLWLHLELEVIWEKEIEDLNLLQASMSLSLLRSRNNLSCSSTAFSKACPYFIINSKFTLEMNFLFLTHPHCKPFIPT